MLFHTTLVVCLPNNTLGALRFPLLPSASSRRQLFFAAIIYSISMWIRMTLSTCSFLSSFVEDAVWSIFGCIQSSHPHHPLWLKASMHLYIHCFPSWLYALHGMIPPSYLSFPQCRFRVVHGRDEETAGSCWMIFEKHYEMKKTWCFRRQY